MEIGKDKVYIVAEAGINHNGDYGKAKQLVDIAIEAGCNAVKFQTFKKCGKIPYDNISFKETYWIKRYCDNKGITFFSTPYSLRAVDFLEASVPFYKIASAQIVDHPFVKYIANKGKPIIASTGSYQNDRGLAPDDKVEQFVSLVDRKNLVLLHCVSIYPYDNFILKDFEHLKKSYPDIPIGFSSHSKNIDYTIEAVKNGACLVEHHITLDDNFECPDKFVSLNPEELYQLVKRIREIE